MGGPSWTLKKPTDKEWIASNEYGNDVTRADCGDDPGHEIKLLKSHWHGNGYWLGKFPSSVEGCAALCPGSKYITYAIGADRNCMSNGGSNEGFDYEDTNMYLLPPASQLFEGTAPANSVASRLS